MLGKSIEELWLERCVIIWGEIVFDEPANFRVKSVENISGNLNGGLRSLHDDIEIRIGFKPIVADKTSILVVIKNTVSHRESLRMDGGMSRE